MNVKCPSCETIYRIDPAKIPEEGVRVRCAVCSFAIALSAQAPEIDAPAVSTDATAPAIVPEQPPVIDPPAAETVGEAEVEAPPEDEGVEEAARPTAAEEVATLDEVETPSEELSGPGTEKSESATRMSEPFVAPREAAQPTGKPVTRPTAPVFKPTPGTPLQAPPVPPAESVTAAEAPAPAALPDDIPAPAQASAAVTLPEETQAPLETPSPVAAPPDDVAAPVEAPAPVAQPEEVEAPAPPARAINPFLQRDPKQKARRLARALISDMIVYQPQKRQAALDNGTLKEEFEEEIKKSWEEYVDQIGDEIANSTTYFRDALNDILSGGQEVF